MRLEIHSVFLDYWDLKHTVHDWIDCDLTTSGSINQKEFDSYYIHFDYTVNNLLPPIYTEPSTKSGLTYTGEEQELIDDNGSVTKGGTMQYAIGQDNTSAPSDGWSDNIPTAADAGNHYVWFRVTSVRGINEAAPKCLPVVTIEKTNISSASVTPTGVLTATDQGLVPHVTTAATTVNNQPVTFTYSKTQNGEYGAMPAFPDFNNDVTVYYKASAPNHYDYFGSFIVPKMQEQTITVEDVTLDFGETGSVSATSNAGGTISYAVKTGSENYIAIDANTGALTLKKYPADGKAYVTVTAAAVGDYVTTTKDMTVTVNLVIKSSLGWDQLIREVAGGNSFAGKTITLANDISVTTMVGSYDNRTFNGTFDGDGVHGGFVGTSGVTKFTDCLFDGSISGSNTDSCCGFLGWGGKQNNIYVTNCLNLGTFSTKRDHFFTFANFYYAGYLKASNSYYRNAYDTSQGTQTNKTGSALQAQLGEGWVAYGNKVVPACFTTTPCYTVTWKNDYGKVIDTTEVDVGIVPTHADPTKTADENYTYTFSGWTPEVVAVTGETTYTATFTAATRFYDVIVDTEHGTVTANPDHASKDTQITLTAEPDANYVLSTIEAHKEEVDNRRVPLTALDGNGGTKSYTYALKFSEKGTANWNTLRDYGTDPQFRIEKNAMGNYRLSSKNNFELMILVKDSKGQTAGKIYSFTVSSSDQYELPIIPAN